MTKDEVKVAAVLGAGVLALLWYVRKVQAIPVVPTAAIKWETQ